MSNLSKYKIPGLDQEITKWIDHNLKNYLKTNPENQTEIEHIIDLFQSDKRPKRLVRVSYKAAVKHAEKWVENLNKKASEIVETDEDTATEMALDNGFRLAKLKGSNAFKREGNLMRHCVGSYADRDDVNVYSLRDANNNPHCTIEVNQSGDGVSQIKGKGNGSIHPKYVDHVIKVLKHFGMEVRSNEMENLGYSSLTSITGLNEFLENNFEGIKYISFNNSKYFYKHSNIKAKALA